jgi:hypothetical protein
MTNQLYHWLQKTQINIKNFEPMFKIFKIFFSRIKLIFFCHEASKAWLVTNLSSLTSNLSSYNPFSPKPLDLHLQRLSKSPMPPYGNFTGFKRFFNLFFLFQLAPSVFLLKYNIKMHSYTKSHYFTTPPYFLRFFFQMIFEALKVEKPI